MTPVNTKEFDEEELLKILELAKKELIAYIYFSQ